MDTPGYHPTASTSNIVTDHSDNDSRSGAGSDNDDEEGEPPSIFPFNNKAMSAYTSHLSGSFSTIMTVGQPHCRLKTMSGRSFPLLKIHRRDNRCSSRFAAMASLVVILFCHSTLLCVADDDANILHTVQTEEEVIHPDTAVLQHDQKNISPSGNCNYECCLSFIDIISQNDRNHFVEHDRQINPNQNELHQLRGTNSGMRMLEGNSTEGNSTVPKPCPAEKDDTAEGGIGIPIGVQYFLIVILVMFSAIFSGLTLGLMSLDPSGLEIVMANADDPRLARAAKAIYPVRLNGNLLLCTLLLGNVGVNSLLSIFMADLTNGLVGFIVSTGVIVIFGEIIPQAICSRFALQVGEKTVPMVKVIIVLLYPICKPLSMILNKALGHEIGTTYSTSEMAKLIEMHVQRGHLEGDTGAAMTGALRYRMMGVKEVMTPLVNTFMLSADERLGFDTVAKIFKTGYSRIPVYEVTKSNIIGLLFVKDLIFLDPEDEIPVKNFVQIFGRGLHVVWPDDKLGDVLKLLKSGRSHMALVRDVNDGDGKVDPYYEINGIITLEDIIEIIIGEEIVDETDELVDVNDPESHVRRTDIGEYIEGALEKSSGHDSPILGGASDRGSTCAINWEARLRLLDERLVTEHLSPDEVRAVAAHLKTNYSKAVELISDRRLKELLSCVPVCQISPASSCRADGGDDGSGVPTDSAELIYERGVPAEFCTVVLSGKIMVVSGADKFRSDVSNWGVLASRALTNPSYVPDFTAWVLPNQNSSGGCRCVKLDRKSYCDAVDNTALERNDHNAQPAVAMPATITKVSHVVLNGESLSQKEIGSYVTLPSGNLAPKKADSTKLLMDALVKPTTNALPPLTEGDSVHIEHTSPSYVRTNVQKKTHSRRSKLLKAFTRAAAPEKK